MLPPCAPRLTLALTLTLILSLSLTLTLTLTLTPTPWADCGLEVAHNLDRREGVSSVRDRIGHQDRQPA